MTAACESSARAATEFCPAELEGADATSPTQPAMEYSYRMEALAPRVVQGTVIADTDQGWFTWTQLAVPLTRATFTTTTKDLQNTFVVADSPEMSVTFPQAVVVRRAWLRTASTQGDAFFGWDARGTVTCEPPDFAAMFSHGTGVTKRTPQPGEPTPAPPPPAVAAVPSVAPFPDVECEHPFKAATVTDAAIPEFPEAAKDEGIARTEISIIYIALNAGGKIVDAWIFARSGYATLDQSALTAAKRSSYSAPISYCRAVTGTYLFRADFRPY